MCEHDTKTACPEYRRLSIGRRGFLGGAMAGLGAVAASAALPKFAFADMPTDKRLILVILRGGMDGLAAVPAYGDRAYKSSRNGLALPESALLDLDGFFGLHSALAPLHQYWGRGELAVFHAMATPYRERSHFDAQNLLELGSNKPHGMQSGWLNRTLGLYGDAGAHMGMAISQALPLVMHGEVAVGSWYPSGRSGPSDEVMMRIARMYERDEIFHNALMEAVSVKDMVEDAGGDAMTGGSTRGGARGGLAAQQRLVKQAIETAGKMMVAADGPRIMSIEIGGWDTHAGQGVDKGGLANKLGQLGAGLDALASALGPVWHKTAICVVTEFGRTVAMNGSNGTDHGTAGAGFLLGGAVNGKQVVAKWPGLERHKLYQGRDLAPTTDMRSLFKALLVDHMGLSSRDIDKHIFPGSATAQRLRGLIRA